MPPAERLRPAAILDDVAYLADVLGADDKDPDSQVDRVKIAIRRLRAEVRRLLFPPPSNLSATSWTATQLADGLADDSVTAHGLYLALEGMRALGPQKSDIDAVSAIAQALERSIDEREEQASAVREALATVRGAEAAVDPHPAWERELAALHEELHATPAQDDKAADAINTKIDALQELIGQTAAATPAGIAAQLRCALYDYITDTGEIEVGIITGSENAALTNALRSLERLAGRA